MVDGAFECSGTSHLPISLHEIMAPLAHRPSSNHIHFVQVRQWPFALAHLPCVERCRYIGARSCLRGVILRMLSSRKEMVDAIDSAVAAEGWKIVMYLRLSPVVCCQSGPGSGCGGVPAPRPQHTLPTTTRLLPFCMPAAKDASPPPCSVPKVPICCLPSSAASTLA